MEDITLILMGVTFLFYFIQWFKGWSRMFSMGGAIFGVCSIAALLTAPWDAYTLLMLVPLAYIELMLLVGAVVDENS